MADVSGLLIILSGLEAGEGCSDQILARASLRQGPLLGPSHQMDRLIESGFFVAPG
jgi:hypothetical protein